MSLFEEIRIENLKAKPRSEVNTSPVKHTEIKIDRTINPIISNITQFFLFPSITMNLDSLYIPVGNPLIENVISVHLMPHFEEAVREETSDGRIDISMRKLRPDSKIQIHDLLDSGQIHTYITDLYGHEYKYQSIPAKKLYNVDMTQITPLKDAEFDQLWNFFKNTYLNRQGVLGLLPTDWNFDESFKNHSLVRILADRCTLMNVFVSADNKITNFNIYLNDAKFITH
ncbi:hypothetical protein ACTHSJ_33450 [Paenibacillus cellulositrophicus]|uniref:hypothetical protein n=1 Tax=Paenibacillus cellulositrophicus TaxID=562959 RepID=UPI003F7D28F1